MSPPRVLVLANKGKKQVVESLTGFLPWLRDRAEIIGALVNGGFLLGMALFVVFALWMVTAWGIWSVTLGPEPEASVGGFLRGARRFSMLDHRVIEPERLDLVLDLLRGGGESWHGTSIQGNTYTSKPGCGASAC